MSSKRKMKEIPTKKLQQRYPSMLLLFFLYVLPSCLFYYFETFFLSGKSGTTANAQKVKAKGTPDSNNGFRWWWSLTEYHKTKEEEKEENKDLKYSLSLKNKGYPRPNEENFYPKGIFCWSWASIKKESITTSKRQFQPWGWRSQGKQNVTLISQVINCFFWF